MKICPSLALTPFPCPSHVDFPDLIRKQGGQGICFSRAVFPTARGGANEGLREAHDPPHFLKIVLVPMNTKSTSNIISCKVILVFLLNYFKVPNSFNFSKRTPYMMFLKKSNNIRI